MAVSTGLLRVQTEGELAIVDLTEGVARVIASSGATDGLVSVFVTGSTAAVVTMEFEPGGVADLRALLARLAPREGAYAHNELNGDDNAHSHLRATLLGAGQTVPLVAGRLVLGAWQQLVLVELDDRPRSREIHVQIAS